MNLSHVRPVVSLEMSARLAESRDRQAEQLARLHRLNRDRIIQAALDLLMVEAVDQSIARGYHDYIHGAANLETSHLTPGEIRAYVDSLLAGIRSELSPVVRQSVQA